MNNAEQKLQELRNQLDQLDTAAAHARVASNLRSAWQQHSNSSTTTIMEHVPETIPNTANPGRKNWRMLGFTFGGLSLAGLALVTTLIVNVNDVSPPSSNLSQTTAQQVAVSDNAKPKDGKINSSGTSVQFDPVTLGSSDATGLTDGINLRDIDMPDIEFEPLMASDYDDDYNTVDPTAQKYEEYGYENYDSIANYPNEPDYTYTNGDEPEQLFSESVGLTIEVKKDLLEIMSDLRTEVSNRSGYLVNISYYNESGTINIQVPADQLSAFEEKLSELDANHEVEVNQYNVQNVSSEVVAMDEYLKIADTQVKDLEAIIASNETTQAEREDAKTQLETTNKLIDESKQKRDEEIAKYNLVNVTVYVTKYQSFWEGNYYQYDRSTLSGLVKYEFGKAVYSLVRSTGKVTTFFVWLLVYSAIFVPAFYIIRGIIRKIRKSIKKN